MNTKRNTCLLILTSLIWGTAFVAQKTGGSAVGPFTFNCFRSFIGGVVLLPVIVMMDQMGLSRKSGTREQRKTLIVGGICCGVCLGIASNTQQLGICLGSEVGKAGFLTACYILIVPLLGILLGKRCGWNIWVGVGLTLIGLYLLCMTKQFSVQLSDVILLLCALGFSIHIMCIDYFSPLVDGVRMSCIQFFVSGILSMILMFWSDMGHSISGIASWTPSLMTWEAWIPILYAGVFSSGAGYTLQIIGQQGMNPTIASLLMSLESVFSVLAGWIILHQKLSVKEIMGCVLIFAAIVLAQIPMGAGEIEMDSE